VTRLRAIFVGVALALGACPALAQAQPAVASRQMVATAHPLASDAGREMLRRGGSAIDAAVAAALVLSVVEPHASGLGGGAVMMAWDQSTGTLRHFDGVSAAPRAVGSSLLAADEREPPRRDLLLRSARAAAVPGEIALLALAHERMGRLPWASLFGPALAAAEAGFPLPREMATVLGRSPTGYAAVPLLRQLYFDAAGQPLPAGTMLRNPEQAAALRMLAAQGPAALYGGEIGQAVVRAVADAPAPGAMTIDDLTHYRARERDPLCAAVFTYRLCTAAPPVSGGIALLQQLSVLQRLNYAGQAFGTPQATHFLLEASRLAAADRRRWVADPDLADIPTQGLVEPGYLDRRAALVSDRRAMASVEPGDPPRKHGALPPESAPLIQAGTSHISVVDAAGNAVALTVTNNLNFGARVQPMGFTLNNGLSNFSPNPAALNAMAPGKRPATTMAPTIVFGPGGRPAIVAGAGGGAWIIDALAVGLAEMLAHGSDPAAAVALARIGAQNGRSQIERGSPVAAQEQELRALGHDVQVVPVDTGMQVIEIVAGGLRGGADPRRDGVALGD
jgi:gamma-glutamyltranspeptidase / glutathione hydrolase